MKPSLCLIALLLIACGKETPAPAEAKKEAAAAAVGPQPVVPKKELPPVPQGELPVMDPEKAKFIAVPSTPEDGDVKKSEKAEIKPVPEIKKVEKPTGETKKVMPETETKKAEVTKPAVDSVPEVKKAEVPTGQ